MKKGKIGRAILERITNAGMTGECYIEEWRESAVTGKQGEIREETTAQGQGLGIRVVSGLRAASISTTRLDPELLARSVDRMIALVPQLPEDPFLRMAQPMPLPQIDAPRDRSFRLPMSESAVRELLNSYDSIKPALPTGSELELYVSARENETTILNTNGLDSTATATSFSRVISVTLETDGERIQSGDERICSFLSDLPPFGKLYQDLLPLLDQTIAGKPIASGEYPAVFHPAAGRTFLRAVLRGLSGWLVNQKRTWLADKLDTQIASLDLTITDDPHDPGSPFSRPFDGEGVPTAPKMLIERGVLRGFFDTLGTAAESGRVPGNAVRSYDSMPKTGWSLIKMAPGSAMPEDMIGETREGLYVMRLIGIGMDEISGNYSIGAMGRRIVNGTLGDAVAGITVAGKLGELLRDIDRIGNDLTPGYQIQCPTFRIRRMAVAGS